MHGGAHGSGAPKGKHNGNDRREFYTAEAIAERWAIRALIRELAIGFQIYPPYCLSCECYPGGAVGADDPTSRDRVSLTAFEARSMGGAVGGSGPL